MPFVWETQSETMPPKRFKSLLKFPSQSPNGLLSPTSLPS